MTSNDEWWQVMASDDEWWRVMVSDEYPQNMMNTPEMWWMLFGGDCDNLQIQTTPHTQSLKDYWKSRCYSASTLPILLPLSGRCQNGSGMQLARGASTSIATADKKVAKDALIVVLAYNQRRFYVFSHIDPVKDAEQAKNINQDSWNEAPTAHQLLGSEGNAARGAVQAAAYSKAILRTTMGDIDIKFFLEVPKTLGNFCGHARSGYYDNVIFHRIIQGFML
jgi:hypothetical protein